MATGFKKAQRTAKKIKMSIQGPSGAGKTYSALSVATALINKTDPGKRIAFIDTEHSAAMYSPPFDFDVDDDFGEGPNLSYHPSKLIEKLESARKSGEYGVVVIDSMTHIWDGQGGFLSMHAALGERQKAKGKQEDTWGNWKFIDPDYDALWTYIRNYPLHVILCMRSEEKTEKNAAGKIEKVGLQAIFRKKWEFEVDIQFAVVDQGSIMTPWKHRLGNHLHDKIFKKPGDNVVDCITAYLAEGVPEPVAGRPIPKEAIVEIDEEREAIQEEASPNTERQPEAVAKTPVAVLAAKIEVSATLGDLAAVKAEIKTALADKMITMDEYTGTLSPVFASKNKSLKAQAAA